MNPRIEEGSPNHCHWHCADGTASIGTRLAGIQFTPTFLTQPRNFFRSKEFFLDGLLKPRKHMKKTKILKQLNQEVN
jgi:hypothetical protein